ncbi:4-oxalocrotonate tautomerase [Mycoplana sp. BE70]|uniref:tautomerase family protein n=1 Tax=Mycoplana sp. BE70 TaxID=2817775 RepID=UPI0028643D25|nr:4-oxalocrotonate tautomerase [Mycoplana sp. BE70]
MPVIRVSFLKGRSRQQKAEAAEALTAALVDHFGSKPEDVTVVFDEKAREDWAIAGKLLSQE